MKETEKLYTETDKKDWKKPELIDLDTKNTQNNPTPAPTSDGGVITPYS